MGIWGKAKSIFAMYVFSTVFNREGLRLGKNSGWGVGCFINAGGGVSIGDNVLIGPHVVIHSLNHNYMNLGVLICRQGHTAKPVVLEDDVWVGASVVILPGVHIGRGAVVGAGAVVSKNVPAFSVVAGNPAVLIKQRGLPLEG